MYEAGRLRPAQLKGLAEVSASTHTGNALPVLRALAASAMQEGVGGRYDEHLRLIDLILLNAKGATATGPRPRRSNGSEGLRAATRASAISLPD